jgi:Cupin domain
VLVTETHDRLIDAVRSGGDPNGIVKAFADNAAFRAATLDELVNEANPFRRPVRPDDLHFLDYSAPLPVEKLGSLSALLGHRMLLNAYESDLVFLPEPAPSASWTDSRSFYSNESRLLAELARPVLEHHLFSFLASPADLAGSGGSLVDYVLAGAERAADSRVPDAICALDDPRGATHFLVLQLSAAASSRAAAFGRVALGDDGGVIDATGAFLAAFEQERRRVPLLRELQRSCGLSDSPRAYWQFYLGSTLACLNHVHRVCRDQTRLFEAVGALAYYTVVEPVLAAKHGALTEQTLGVRSPYFDVPVASRAQVDSMVSPLLARYGDPFAEGFRRGFAAADLLGAFAEADLVTQVEWADQLEFYKERGDAIRRHIRDEGIEVDLDTFVESWEVTSTTHVHDKHRLVVIERGEMHFWNNVGRRIPLSTGDAILIPKGRLHGSTVLSGECTYHQPIIPDGLLKEIA